MARPGATHRAAAPFCPRRPGTHRSAPPSRSPAFGRLPETPAYSMIPGWRPPPGPGSPGVRRYPAGSPAIPEPGPRARRHLGVPAGAPVHPLRRYPQSAPPPGRRSPCGRHDERGPLSTTAIQEDPVGGRRVRSLAALTMDTVRCQEAGSLRGTGAHAAGGLAGYP
jgi:hypothetical protein